jgi:hypothetical protein
MTPRSYRDVAAPAMKPSIDRRAAEQSCVLAHWNCGCNNPGARRGRNPCVTPVSRPPPQDPTSCQQSRTRPPGCG